MTDPGNLSLEGEALDNFFQLEFNAAKYKPVAKKIKPVNQPMPISLNPPLTRPTLSRDLHSTPLMTHPPELTPTHKITEERLALIYFGPTGWLSEEELKLMKHLINLRQGALAFSEGERALLKHSYGKPYTITVIPHEPWQQKPIPIPDPIKNQFIELVR